jgi:hypothetical protein
MTAIYDLTVVWLGKSSYAAVFSAQGLTGSNQGVGQAVLLSGALGKNPLPSSYTLAKPSSFREVDPCLLVGCQQKAAFSTLVPFPFPSSSLTSPLAT